MVKVLGFIVCYELLHASTSQLSSQSTFFGRPVSACAFFRPHLATPMVRPVQRSKVNHTVFAICAYC